MYQYDTVVAAIDGLKERGYNLDFNIAFDKLLNEIFGQKGI